MKSTLSSSITTYIPFNGRFTIEHGSITYQNRILLSDAYQKALSTGEAHYAEYGTGRSDSLENPPNGLKRLEATSSWLLSR